MTVSDSKTKYYGLKVGKFPLSVDGTFTATGQSASQKFLGEFNVVISGGVATVEIQKSFDDGSTWYTLSSDATGTAAEYTTASAEAFNGVVEEREADILYRLNCTAYTSGTVTYRMSQ